MAMGILQALKLQEGPIESLAQLPQQQLIAMSQQGRIPADVLPIILNEKAQMAQAAANMQAMQRPMQPSVIEQAMAINAQAEAPQMAPQEMPEDAGVASLPVPDDMYSDEGYAGGGIVAFDNGGLAGSFDMFMPEYGSVDQRGADTVVPTAGPARDSIETLRAKAAAARASMSPENRALYDENISGVRRAAPAPTAPAKETGIAAIPAKESMLDRRRRMLEQLGVTDTTDADLAELEKNRGRLADDKFDALRMSLIRAGLGMAAGTSPYALTNIAKGGIEGFDTYEQSIKQIKAEEKEYGKLARDLRKEANAVKRSDVDKALDLESKAELMDLEREKLKYTRQSALKPSTFQEQLNALTGGSKDPKVIQEATRIILGASKTGSITDKEIYESWSKKPDYEKKMLQKEGINNFDDFLKREREKGTGAVPGVKFLGVR
jgi:hypothetical protein